MKGDFIKARAEGYYWVGFTGSGPEVAQYTQDHSNRWGWARCGDDGWYLESDYAIVVMSDCLTAPA